MKDPLRVLQVVTHMNRGGLETMLMNYYRSIDREKVQFDFLVHRNERGAYDDEIEALGGNIFRLPRLVPWSIGYRRALSDFFSAHKEYKIVHVHQDCLSSVILKAAKNHGVPIRIAHSHNCNQDKNIKYLVKMFYRRFICKYATDLFACGKDAGAWMFRGADFRILNNAIDADIYRYDYLKAAKIREKLKIPKDALVVGHVGRFNPQKNHAFLIDIFAELQKRRNEAKLLLVGDGSLRSEAEQKVKSLGLENNVIFTGVRSDVNELMQAMDVFVFPSLYEGLPLTLVEAQAAGLPCCVSNTVSAEAAVTGNIHFLSLQAEPGSWAEEILLNAENFERCDTTAEIVRAGYDISACAVELEKFYLERSEQAK